MTFRHFLFKKVIKNRLTWIIMLIICGSIFGFYFANNANYQKQSLQHYLQSERLNINESYKNNKSRFEDSKKNQDDIESFEENKKYTQENLASVDKAIDNLNKGNLKEVYRFRSEYDKKGVEAMKTSMKNGNYSSSDSGGFAALLHSQRFFESLSKSVLPEQYPGMEVNGYDFVLRMLSFLFPLLIPMLLAFILSQIFTERFKERLDIYSLYPSKKIKTESEELSVGLLIGVGTITGAVILSFIIATIFHGTGSIDYPTLLLGLGDKFNYIPNYQILLPTIILQILSVIFIIVLMKVLINLFKNQYVALLISIAIIAIAPIGMRVNIIFKGVHLLPSTYIMSEQVVNGTYLNLTNNGQVTFLNGCAVLVVTIIALLAANLLLIKRKN